MSGGRDWSVHPAWLSGEPKFEYPKVRALEGAIAVGKLVSIQRQGETVWRTARVVEQPADRDGHGHMLWLELEGTCLNT